MYLYNLTLYLRISDSPIQYPYQVPVISGLPGHLQTILEDYVIAFDIDWHVLAVACTFQTMFFRMEP